MTQNVIKETKTRKTMSIRRKSVISNKKAESLSQTHKNFATQCRSPKIFQTMNSVRSNNVSLKYKRPTPSGCKDIRIIKFEFVAKTQFFSPGVVWNYRFRDEL